MIFEEALKALREGKKIRSPFFEDDEYLMGCYIGLPDYYDDNGILIQESFEDRKSRGLSIVKMKGDRQHNDMVPFRQSCRNPELHIYPQLNLFLVMREDWEIIE